MGCSSSTPAVVEQPRQTPQANQPPKPKPKPAVRIQEPKPPAGGGAKAAGGGADAKKALKPAPSARSVPYEDTIIKPILNLTDGKPLDARDVTDLGAAKKEIQFIRKFAEEFLQNFGGEEANDEEDEEGQKDEHVDRRGALYDKQDFASFKIVSYEKSDEIRSLIYDACKSNVLFEHDTPMELMQIVDVFRPREYKEGEVVIRQGDEGDDFFVVESGKLSIHVTVKDKDEAASTVKVGDYSTGAPFGELALIFGSPRAATITATSDCKLWSIQRQAYRSVISRYRFEQHKEKSAFLQKCVVNDRSFTDIFDAGQLEDLTIATKADLYKEGDVVLREGVMGDTFYIVKRGQIDTYKGGKKSKVLTEKETFGTTSLLKGIVSPQTYKAAKETEVFYLTREDFDAILGSFQDALDGNTVSRTLTKLESKRTVKTSMTTDCRHDVGLDGLDFFNVLGRGAFGQVFLVQARATKKVFALKQQSKHYIEKKGQKEHVLNEFRIMREIEHPTIGGIHCAMQDKEHLYFLLDLLPGGELMPSLVKQARSGKGFTENVTRFFAASVVLAFEQLHKLMIAYRDLKPENIVLTKKGYGVVVDFGLAKEIDEGQTYTFCGTPDYLAPEIIRGTGHDWAVDYWGLGVFLFEMTNGTAPFFATNQARRTRKILKGFEFVRNPAHFSGGLTDLITHLLTDDQSKRLGRTKSGPQGIINHRWFAGFDWDAFEEKTMKAPIEVTIPEDIKTLGKKPGEDKAFQEALHAPESDWWPDLANLAEW